jgi:hypothetical protein
LTTSTLDPTTSQVRYPRATAARAPRAAWRGTNTDRRIDPMDESNALDALRSRLHLMGRWYPDIFDAHYTDFGQRAFDTQVWSNGQAAALDVRGL